MEKEGKKKQVDDDLLDLSLKMVAAVLVVVFVCFFFWWRGDIKSLGEIGDFFGGMLNPIVAFAALLWLMVGVRMQRRELAAAKDAMQTNLRISALTALITAKSDELSALAEELAVIAQNMASSGRRELHAEKLADRERVSKERRNLILKLEGILSSSEEKAL